MVRGARLWNNSDDGFDAWEFLSPITIENSLAYGNGFNRWSIPNYTGDGNGFSGGDDVDRQPARGPQQHGLGQRPVAGSSTTATTPASRIERCTAWDNLHRGRPRPSDSMR